MKRLGDLMCFWPVFSLLFGWCWHFEI